jgi:hypothetical protein
MRNVRRLRVRHRTRDGGRALVALLAPSLRYAGRLGACDRFAAT